MGKTHATLVAFPHDLMEIAQRRRDELRAETVKQSNRLSERFGRNREGYLFTAAVATCIASLARDQAKLPDYGGEPPDVLIPQPMINGKPRADVIEELLMGQAVAHREAHRKQFPGEFALPSNCHVCQSVSKLGLPIAADDEVGVDHKDLQQPKRSAVLIIQGDAETIAAVMRASAIPDMTPYVMYLGDQYERLRYADRNELLHAIMGEAANG